MHNAQSLPSSVRYANLGIARCHILLGKENLDLASLREVAKRNKMASLEGEIYRLLGEILMHLGGSHIAEAKQWMQKAIEAHARKGMMFLLGLDHAVYAELFGRQGDRIKAQEEFGKAIEILRECGADGWVEKYERELAALR